MATYNPPSGSAFDPGAPGPVGDEAPDTGAFTALAATSLRLANGAVLSGTLFGSVSLDALQLGEMAARATTGFDIPITGVAAGDSVLINQSGRFDTSGHVIITECVLSANNVHVYVKNFDTSPREVPASGISVWATVFKAANP